MIEEEKWAAPSMTYFRPHFMVNIITKVIVIPNIIIIIPSMSYFRPYFMVLIIINTVNIIKLIAIADIIIIIIVIIIIVIIIIVIIVIIIVIIIIVISPGCLPGPTPILPLLPKLPLPLLRCFSLLIRLPDCSAMCN